MAEFAAILYALLAVVGNESNKGRKEREAREDLFRYVHALRFFGRRRVARQIGLVEMEEIDGTDQEDEDTPEGHIHSGAHEEPHVEDCGVGEDAGIGHRVSLRRDHDEKGEREEAEDVAGEHAVLNKLAEAA